MWDAGTGGTVTYASTTTAIDGAYQFTGLDAGSYVVTQTDAPGYVSTTTNSQTVSVGASAVTGVDFGDTLTFTVTGVVFNDADGDGVQKPTEPGTPDVPVQLYDDANANGLVEAGEALLGSTVTDGSGNYAIRDIKPGYRVLRILAPGRLHLSRRGPGRHAPHQRRWFRATSIYQNFPLVADTEPQPACAYNTSIVSRFQQHGDPGRTHRLVHQPVEGLRPGGR